MKWFVLFALVSLPAFAGMNELECDGFNRDNARMRVEVSRGFGGSMRDARSIVYGARGTNPTVTQYRIFQIRKFGQYQLQYVGDQNFMLQVELFPDQAPRWGWSYRSRLGSSNLNCRFPNP